MASSVTLHPRPPPPPAAAGTAAGSNPLPPLLQTPSGLAVLELQGAINLPGDGVDGSGGGVCIGRLDFPDYDAGAGTVDTAWMASVQLYVGRNQRLTGEVRKLARPLAVIRRRKKGEEGEGLEEEEEAEELEVVEVVKYKLVFSQRPEPVGTAITE